MYSPDILPWLPMGREIQDRWKQLGWLELIINDHFFLLKSKWNVPLFQLVEMNIKKNPTRSYRFNEFKQIWSSENNFLISSLDLFYIKKRIDMDHLLKLICWIYCKQSICIGILIFVYYNDCLIVFLFCKART